MKKYHIALTGLLLVGLIAAGCDRHIASTDPVRSLGDPPPVPSNVQALLGNSSVTLTWQIDNPSEVMKYRVYTAQPADGSFSLKDSTTDTTITIDNLLPNRTYAFAVSSVTTSNIEGRPSTPVTTAISLLSIQINGGSDFTNNRNVTIRVNANTTVTHIKLSEDPTLSDAEFVLFTGTQTNFGLDSPGDGVKYVYAALQFDDGASTNGPLVDSITLDTKATIQSISYENAGSVFSAGDTLRFTLDAGESGGTASVSFTGGPTVNLADDDEDGVYTGEWVIPGNFNTNAVLVTGRFTDAAGNGPVTLSADNTLTIASPPLPVTASALPLSTYQIRLSWSEATTSDFAAYNIYRGNSAAVDNSGTPIKTITSSSTRTFVDSTLADNIEYFYRVYVVTGAGLTAGSEVVSATTFVNTPPAAVQLVATVSSGSVQFNWTASGEDDFDSYQIYQSTSTGVNTNDDLVVIQQNRTITSANISVTAGVYYYRLYVRDKHGLQAGSNEVQVVTP